MTPTAWLAAAQTLHQSQQPFALVTVLRVTPPTSARPGDKAVVTADGTIHGWIGGGCAQPAVVKTVRAALQDRQPRTIRITPSDESQEQLLDDVLEFGMSCHSGGTLELFIDPVVTACTLAILGDSPVAVSLADLAPRVGFSALHLMRTEDFTQLPQHTAVVVATQGRGDMPALRAALHASASPVWFVASARKASVLKDNLCTAGHAREYVDAIIAPAGTPIGAQTPEEIALSVLTAVIAHQRGIHTHAGASNAPAPAPTPTASKASTAPKNSCCGGKTAVSTAPPEPVAAAPKKSCCGG
jgi:xanthine dehydrogenase accessory factor